MGKNFALVWHRIKETSVNRRYRCQRAKQGWATCDLWDMRNWFVKTLGAMLREMGTNLISYPEELTEEEWQSILLEMAELLETFDIWDDSTARQKANVDPDDDSQESYALIKAEQYKAKEHFFYLFNKWFYHLGI